MSRALLNRLPAMSLGAGFTFAATQGLLVFLLLWHSAVEDAVAYETGATLIDTPADPIVQTAPDQNGSSQVDAEHQGEQNPWSEENNKVFEEVIGDYYLDTKERKAKLQANPAKQLLIPAFMILLCLVALEIFRHFYLQPNLPEIQKSYSIAYPGRKPLDREKTITAVVFASPFASAFVVLILYVMGVNMVLLPYRMFKLGQADDDSGDEAKHEKPDSK